MAVYQGRSFIEAKAPPSHCVQWSAAPIGPGRPCGAPPLPSSCPSPSLGPHAAPAVHYSAGPATPQPGANHGIESERHVMRYEWTVMALVGPCPQPHQMLSTPTRVCLVNKWKEERRGRTEGLREKRKKREQSLITFGPKDIVKVLSLQGVEPQNFVRWPLGLKFSEWFGNQ
jgi:hypothetical protein